jgi:hypothetical protein
MTFTSCDSEIPYEFYGPDFLTSYATVLELSAPGCDPCVIEAPVFQSQIGTPSESRGVRVITALDEGILFGFSFTTCSQWRSAFGITGPVVEDTTESVVQHLGAVVVPFFAVIDRHGRIVYTQQGIADLTALRAAIEAALAE